jgi:hypothetical protein
VQVPPHCCNRRIKVMQPHVLPVAVWLVPEAPAAAKSVLMGSFHFQPMAGRTQRWLAMAPRLGAAAIGSSTAEQRNPDVHSPAAPFVPPADFGLQLGEQCAEAHSRLRLQQTILLHFPPVQLHLQPMADTRAATMQCNQ